MQIIPMKDLKNTAEVERRCVDEQGPIFVTKNGYGRLVVMDIDFYNRTLAEFLEDKAILEGLNDVRLGRVVDGETAISEIRQKYGV